MGELAPHLTLSSLVVDDPDRVLGDLIRTGRHGSARKGSVALLSPRVWGAVDQSWREHPQVRQITFRIREEAWPVVADAIGLPLGPYA